MNTEQFDGHTPGPWYLNTPDPNPARTVRFISDVCTDLLGASDADAHLIAAAPDLLAALIKEREENRRLRSVKIRQVSCRNGVVKVVLKDENGNLFTFQAPAVDTVVDFGVSHLEPVFERPEGMGGGYVTGWTEQPTPESKPLRFDSHKVEFIELMPDETEESE